MKNQFAFFLSVVFCLVLLGCSKESDPKPENTIDHVGEKWNIVSVEYTMIDQNLTNPSQVADNGTAANAGAFYFNSGKGSFDVTINQTRKEDFFSYTESGSDVTITSVSQNVGGTNFSQNVIALSGEKTSATTMTLEGSITKQSMTGQFVLTGTFMLQKN
jgi:hypothetical protein